MSESKRSKDFEDEKPPNWTYDGSQEEDWDAFDRRMMRWVRKKYGALGEKLWIGILKQSDSLAAQEFEDYCTDVYEAIELSDSTKAW